MVNSLLWLLGFCIPTVVCLQIGIVHDEILDLAKPRFYIEKWITLMLVHLEKSQPGVRFSYLNIPTEEILSNDLEFHLEGAQDQDGVIIMTHCGAANLVNGALIRLNTTKPVLRLEFAVCARNPPGSVARLDSIEAHRLQPEKRIQCTVAALEHWITFQLLNIHEKEWTVAPLSEVLRSCANASELRWKYSFYSTNIQIPEEVARKYIAGRTLRIATLERPPFVMLQYGKGTKEVSDYKGFCSEIINILAEKYNFTYTVTLPPDQSYGTELANGSWNGIIDMILNNEIDIGGGPFSVTYSRQKVIQFTASYYEEPTAILTPPPMEDTRLFACTKPFRWEVWICLLVTMAILPLILWTQFRVFWQLGKESRFLRDETSKYRKPPSLFQHFYYVFSIISSQSGHNVPPIGHSPRLLAAIWCLSCVIFIYVYVGALMSFLSVPKLRPVLGSLEEIPTSKFPFTIRKGTAIEALFTDAKEGTYRIIGESLSKNPKLLTNSDAEGLWRVTNGTSVFIKERSYLEFAMEQDYMRTGECRLSLAKEEFFKANFAFPVSKGSIFLPLFNKQMLYMLQAGLMEHWRKQYWPPPNKCKDAGKVQSSRKLNLTDLQSAFLVLGIGAGLAVFAYLLEWIRCLIMNINLYPG